MMDLGIGMNLSPVDYWSTEFPFIDRVKSAGPWVAQAADFSLMSTPVAVDANGYPTEIPSGAARIFTNVGLDPVSLPMSDTYVLTYSGTATFELLGATILDSQPGQIVFQFTGSGTTLPIVIDSLDASNPLTDLHVVRDDQVSLFQSGEIFNPAFIEKASQWSDLRFMDWGKTNDSPVTTWDERASTSSMSWGDARGVPIEVMVAAANEAHTDMWYNIPAGADDNFVIQAMKYIHANLAPDLHVHVEYSNEVWNFSFPQAQYAQSMANALWGHDLNGDGVIDPSGAESVQGGWVQYYGYRAAQIASIAESEFGSDSSQLINVLAGPADWPALMDYVRAGITLADLGTAPQLFGEYAIATYVGTELSGFSASDRAQVLYWANSGASGLDLAFDEIFNGGLLSNSANSLAGLRDLYTSQSSIARSLGLPLVAYEGGASLTSTSFDAADQATVLDFFTRLMNDPRMGEVYTQMVTDFAAAGGVTLDAYSDAVTPTLFGSWGVLDNIYQNSSARYDALIAAVANGIPVAEPVVKSTPVVTSVVTSGDGITAGTGDIGVGATVKFIVNLSDSVGLSGGIPTLLLNNGGVATYLSGSGNSALTFIYTVATGESTADLAVSKINLNGATISSGILEITSGSGESLTDATGDVFSFGQPYQGTDYIILRNGVTLGAGNTLALVNGVMWDQSAFGWYSFNGSVWVYQPNAPVDDGKIADLSGAVTNPDGILHIDAARPVVTSVTTSGDGITAGTGNLGIGSVVMLTVNTSAAVAVSGGDPVLVLNNGGIATYVDGSGTNALHFSYTVAAGQDTADLAVALVQLNGATISDSTAIVTGGSGHSLIDANGHVFSFGEQYQGTDYIILRDGMTAGAGSALALVNGVMWDDSSFGWYSFNGASWDYQPNAPDLSTGHPIDLTGVVTNPDGILLVDATVPPALVGVTSVTTSGDGITAGTGDLGVGDVVTLTVNTSAVVAVSGGVPTLLLNNGGIATYVDGTGSKALHFSYTVAAGQDTADLAVTEVHLNGATISDSTPTITGGSNQSLTDADGHVFSFGQHYQGTDYIILRDGMTAGAGTALALIDGVVWDDASFGWYSFNGSTWGYEQNAPNLSAGHAIDLSGAATNPDGILQIDASAPVVTSVTTSGEGITAGTGDVGFGDVVTLTVNTSAAVFVSGGKPSMLLNNGGLATYVDGSGTKALHFSYTVAAGQDTADLAVAEVQLNGSTVSDGTPTITAGSGHSLIDGDGHIFSFGQQYQGADYFILRDGMTAGAGTALALVNGVMWDDSSFGWYSYNGSSWLYQPNAPDLSSGHAMDLSGAVTNPDGILHVDATEQQTTIGVTSVTASGDGIAAGTGDLGVGDVVTLTVNTSAAVAFSGGEPSLLLNNGGVAAYAGGSGTKALQFSYTVAAGQDTADLAVTEVHLNGATISDSAPTIAGGSSQSLTDADGHVFSFGQHYQGADYFILRDGMTAGAGTSLALVDGVMWDDASFGWYSYNGTSWVYEPHPPDLSAGHPIDLSGAVANPNGILHIDTGVLLA